MKQEYIDPRVAVSPQDAFYAEKESLPLMETAGRICSEFVMCYPPGIPIWHRERDYRRYPCIIVYAKEKGCSHDRTGGCGHRTAERAERSLKNGIMVYRVSYPQCEILHTGG